MNKKLFSILVSLLATINMWAITTTYTFVGTDWKSRIGTVTLDGKTDGWKANMPATDYNAGYTDADGRLYSCGVGVKTGTTGAGATSVLSFTNITSITVNFCQNTSKGKGQINMKVGDGTAQSFTISKPEKGQGQYNRDTTFVFDGETGNVTFSVDCTENGIYINTITINADNGSIHNPDVSDDVMWVVTDPSELQTGDLVMFGVSDPNVNLVMGYFNEEKSKNNIRAEKATYSKDRTMVNRSSILYEYMVERVGDKVAFSDASGWYLVANGGNPNKGNNNYLTVWDKYTSDSYGDYGLWNISIDDNWAATIKSAGVSRSNTIMYNPNKTAGTDIFACYADTASYTLPVIYKLHGNNSGGFDIQAGDADGNGSINVSDIAIIAAYILGDEPEGLKAKAADFNGDGEINITDISIIAAMILEG